MTPTDATFRTPSRTSLADPGAPPPGSSLPHPGAQLRWLREVRLADGTLCDLEIDDGMVRSLHPSTQSGQPKPTQAPGDVAMPGWLALPTASDPHAHLDKPVSWSGALTRGVELDDTVAHWRSYATDAYAGDLPGRARRAICEYLAHGITAVRSHVDLLGGNEPLRGIEVLVGLREHLRELCDLQVVAVATHERAPMDIAAALHMGADVVGGNPAVAPDPAAEIDRLLELAERFGAGADLHTDGWGDSAPELLAEIAAQTRRRGLQGSVTASHSVGPGSTPLGEQEQLLDALREADVAVVVSASEGRASSGLSDADGDSSGSLLLSALRAAGIRTAAGGESFRRGFDRVGHPDPFDATAPMVTSAHLSALDALDTVTNGARSVLGLAAAGPIAGACADLLLLRGRSIDDVVSGSCPDRLVLRGGRVVARTTSEDGTAGEAVSTPGR